MTLQHLNTTPIDSQIYDTIPAVRNLPLPFQKAMKNFKVGQDVSKPGIIMF
jgi:hypothetical protein